MDYIPWRFAPKPPSPPLRPSRGEDEFLAPKGPAQVNMSPDEGSPDSSSGSRCGFYSIVEDPTSPEAELNEVWMLSPERQVHLTTLKEGKAFKVQTYTGSNKTESLFPDSEESPYRIQPDNRCQVFGEEEERQLRKEIIQKQAPKKNPTFKLSEQLSVLNERDWSLSTNMQAKGLTLSHSPVRLEAPRSAIIDRAQIDFSAARHQFLKLEQGERTVLSHSQSGKTQTSTGNEQRSGPSGTVDDLNFWAVEDVRAEGCRGFVSGKDVFDDSIPPQAVRKGKSDVDDETPIEKEIRSVREREENLQRSRGLKHHEGLSHMVGIQSKRAQSQPIPNNQLHFFIEQGNHEGEVNRQAPEPPRALLHPKEQFQEDRQDQEVILFPCCPHRHAKETSSSSHVGSWTRTLSWRESTDLKTRKNSVPNFIEKEIEEALRRERELQQSRQSRESLESRDSILSRGCREPRREFRESNLHFAVPLLAQASKMTAKQLLPTENSASPLPKGPMGALLRDFEERRERLRIDDGSYAGIEPIDDINNQVVESTRVIRHKSQRALRWEAGLFAN
ncbi:mitotic interactor and substrate of PLK1 isoform X1 [Syngnathus acus]|uniref:mitotic interactor and substrate of PLK1 isoform X1 n=1 Tax=Syngnathus acus TaxID=161584 RepID=UPI001886448B|nr:mitotic interactor and substrate of PLK1 isoform X1 [Syngnathus acus]